MKQEGTSTIDTSYLELLEKTCASPSVLESDNFKVWEEPNPSHVYSIGVDVADGVGECASCVQVVDITDLRDIRQVACYNDRFIDPDNFSKEIYEIAKIWGKPWILVERNSMGASTVAGLEHDPFYYERLVSYDAKTKIDYSKHGVQLTL